jgi:hypothetical protein
LTAISRTHRFALAALFCVAVLAIVPAAFAGKGGGGGHKPSGGGSGGFTLVNLNSPDGLTHYGGQITFTIQSTATSVPNVSVTCSQNGTVVYGAATGYYASYPWPWTNTMTLSSQAWTGGAASCTASLYYFSGTSTITLGSMSFTAYA